VLVAPLEFALGAQHFAGRISEFKGIGLRSYGSGKNPGDIRECEWSAVLAGGIQPAKRKNNLALN